MNRYSVRPDLLTRTAPKPLIFRVLTTAVLIVWDAPATPLFDVDAAAAPLRPAAKNATSASSATATSESWYRLDFPCSNLICISFMGSSLRVIAQPSQTDCTPNAIRAVLWTGRASHAV